MALLSSLWMVIVVPAVSFLSYAIYNLYFHPLSRVPGPFFARLTPLWEMSAFLSGNLHLVETEAHKRYGSIIRVAPNTVLVDDPTYFPVIFNMPRSNWWSAFRASRQYTPHSLEKDPAKHIQQKKLLIGAYQMSSVLRSEKKIDNQIQILVDKLKTKIGKPFDFAPWTQWTAFDIVMDVVFSNPLNFVGQESDINGIIGSLHGLFLSANIVALNPWLAHLLQIPWINELVAPKPGDKSGPGQLHGLAYEQVRKRFETDEKFDDVLQSIIDKNGGTLPRYLLEQESIGPILAGSDTVAVFVRAVVLYLTQNSAVLAKLRKEIDAAIASGKISNQAQYSEIREYVPYAELVVKETLRIYPSIGMPLPRCSPVEGITISGHFIPPGTTVAISQWAVSRNEAIFDDPQAFIPERWLDRSLDTAFIPFHKGSMMCTGQHIALLETTKIMVQLFRTYDFEIVNPEQPWREINRMAMLHWDFFVKVKEREISA